MKIAIKRVDHRVYQVSTNNRVFFVDGQNHEFDSKEWQLFEEDSSGDMVWIETYSTKRDAISGIVRIRLL
jgi:hypothetical protein